MVKKLPSFLGLCDAIYPFPREFISVNHFCKHCLSARAKHKAQFKLLHDGNV